MAAPRPNVCIRCWLSADIRTGNVSKLANGGRIHHACVTPLLLELVAEALAPRPNRVLLNRRPPAAKTTKPT